MPTQHKLVVIENSTLEAMATNPLFIRELPFLRSLAPKPGKRCGSCGGNANNRHTAATYLAAKQTIAGLDSAKKQRLKQLFNTAGLRVVFRNTSGQVVQLTF